MSHDTLAIIWFGLWGLIWAVYFMLDAYVLGTGMLFPFVAKSEREQRQLQDSIGPFWSGNEVWLITAGGATFAAFPLTYALMFSYLYTPLMFILFALFFRAAGLEFMHKDDSKNWKSFWKWGFFGGSLVLALLLGVAFANLFKGLPFDATGYHGSLLSLLNSYGLLGGLTFLSLFLLSGSVWMAVKTSGSVQERGARLANRVWMAAALLVTIFLVATNNKTHLFDNFVAHPVLWILPALSIVSILLVKLFLHKQKWITVFAFISATIVTLMATGFAGMFPNMLLSSLDPAQHVTLYQAAGSRLNLQLMLIVAVIFVPIVIFYQSWMYRFFREKISPENAQGYK
jgi:cytochrome d ubiquinol oxidase subunit II